MSSVPNSRLKAPGFVQQRVEDAAAAFEPVNLLCHRVLVALHEHPFVQLRRAILGGQQHAVARPGEAPVAFVDVDAEIQGREARYLPELLGDELIERNRIAETALEGSARGGQQAVVGAVSARDTRVREPAEDREIAAEFGQER